MNKERQGRIKKTPFFSIVMPTYGVERYLPKAIECILHQSFTDWELIIVDDCSLDSSGLIADEYASVDERINVIHSETNNGLSASRNIGMLKSRGKYIWFPDPDDRYSEQLLQKVYEAIECYPSVPLVMFGHAENWYKSDGSFSHRVKISFPDDALFQRKEIRAYAIDLEESTQYGYAWNKVYSTSYLNAIQVLFRDIPYIEDIDFNVRVLQEISSGAVIRDILYEYAKRPSVSLTGKYNPNFFDFHKERVRLLFRQQLDWNDGKIDRGISSRLGTIFCKYVVASLRMNCYPDAKMSFSDRKAWCNALYNDECSMELIRCSGNPRNIVLTICVKCIKRKNIFGMLVIGRTTYLVERYCYSLISRLKN